MFATRRVFSHCSTSDSTWTLRIRVFFKEETRVIFFTTDILSFIVEQFYVRNDLWVSTRDRWVGFEAFTSRIAATV